MYDLVSLDSWFVGGVIPTFVHFCALGMHIWNAQVLPSNSPGSSDGKESACSWASLVVQLVKNLPAMQDTWV